VPLAHLEDLLKQVLSLRAALEATTPVHFQ